MPIFIGHLLKILTQVVLLPIAQKAASYFINKIENHEKKVEAKIKQAEIEIEEKKQLIEDVKDIIGK